MNTYEILITKTINHEKLHREVSQQMSDFLGFSNNSNEYAFFFNDTFDNLLLEQIIIDHNHIDPLREEIDKYTQRVEDGMEVSIALIAELRLNSIHNNLPRDVNKFIELKLDKVKTNIDRGWWISALEELELVVVESYLTQEFYDRVYNIISNYIAQNY